MRIRRVWNLRGPNMWSRDPVLEIWVELGELAGWRSDAAGFAERLVGLLPGLSRHPAAGSAAESFVEQLSRGVTLAHVLERVVVELQRCAGSKVSFGHTAGVLAEPDVYRVIVAYEESVVAEACLEVALRLCLAAAQGKPFDLACHLPRLRQLVESNRYGRTTSALVEAARRRNIPVEHLNPEDGRLLALGWGCKQRWLLAAQTDRTPDLGQMISQDKQLTKSLLRTIGIPVPDGRVVCDADDAWAAAQQLGLPVAVKPRDRDLSVGVWVNLTSRQEVEAAYRAAREKSDQVIVEQYARGFDHRALVVGEKIVAVSCIVPPMVCGDGRSTIAELVDRENARPERGDGYCTPMARIAINENVVRALRQQGYTLESVPAAGQQVRLNYQPPAFENGGQIVDVTDRIHPEVAARVLEATRLLGLDVAGIDLVAEDIGRPLEEQGGMILEVNVGPALWLHMAPWCDRPRPVAEAIVASVIPEPDDGRIPVVAITGVNGKSTTTWLIAHLLRTAGRKVGMACTDGMYIEGRQISAHDCSGPRSARAILRNPAVDAAVLETARGGILREGLGFDWCDVAVVTNIGEGDHLGLRGVHTVEELAQVKATVVKAVSPKGYAVLNAADPLVAAMAPHCPGQVVYFCIDEHHPVVREHLAAGGRAVAASQGWIVLCHADRCARLACMDEIPMTLGGKVAFQVENALAATAASWVLGVEQPHIRQGLASFVGSPPQAPGRFNVFKLHGATVIVDFAHNASALVALARALDSFPHRRRTIIFGGCDRRDEDVIRQGVVLGDGFDRVVLCRDRGYRDRREGELSELVQRGLHAAHRVSQIVTCSDEREAIEDDLRNLQPDELLVLAPESIQTALEILSKEGACG